MRIIGGEHRGRRIAAPKGRATRPMLDRVREAVFSSAAPWLAEARVLDLFAGSGSLGLEALSRGAASARFVEGNERTAGLLRDNLRELGAAERGQVVVGDALAPRTWAAASRGPFDLVFLDPPYPMITEPQTRMRVLETLDLLLREALAPDGLIVLHVPRLALDRRALPSAAEAAERAYGTNAVWYVTPPEDDLPASASADTDAPSEPPPSSDGSRP